MAPARRNLIVSGARARSIPVFHVDIRLYAIGSTDRKSDGDHDYVRLAQARPNYRCGILPSNYSGNQRKYKVCGILHYRLTHPHDNSCRDTSLVCLIQLMRK